MKREKVIAVKYDIGFDAETAELLERLRREEAQCVSSLVRKIVRSYVMSEAARRGWLRREEAAAPQIASS
jgi:hypothetical protein